jgi:hypothetical protein
VSPFDGLGSPSITFGRARYLKVDLTEFPVSPFTISFRVRPAAGGPVLYYGDPEDAEANPPKAALRIQVEGGAVAVQIGQREVRGTRSLVGGTTHVVTVMVLPGSSEAEANVFLYVDGISDTRGTISMLSGDGVTPWSLSSARTLWIGAEPPDPNQDDPTVPRIMFAGDLTDLRIWSGLTLDLATDADLSGSEPNLYAAWPLDTAHTSYGRNLTLDVSRGGRHASSVINTLQAACYGWIDTFGSFPLTDRTVTMWIRGPGAGTLLSYADAESTDNPNDAGTPWRIGVPGPTFDGLWHHVAVVTDTAAAKETTYFDGVPLGSGTPNGGQIAGQRFLIGVQRLVNEPTDLFTGQIRDVHLWSVARSATDILADANSVPPDSYDGLVARWPLDPASAGIDVSGHGTTHSLTTPHDAGTERSPHTRTFLSAACTVGGRPCDVVYSDTDDLVLVGPQMPLVIQPSTKVVRPDRDLLVIGNHVTVSGALTLPGRQVTIYAQRLGAEAGHSPAASIDVQPPPAQDGQAAGGLDARSVQLNVSLLDLAVPLAISARGGQGNSATAGGTGGAVTISVLSTAPGSAAIIPDVGGGGSPIGKGADGTVSRPVAIPERDRRSRLLAQLVDRAGRLVDDIIDDSYYDIDNAAPAH